MLSTRKTAKVKFAKKIESEKNIYNSVTDNKKGTLEDDYTNIHFIAAAHNTLYEGD